MIVATTLAGPGAESVIGDALRSALGLADEFLVIFSGCDEDATESAVAEALRGSQVGHCLVRFAWTGSYADARNFALEQAEKLGATWALTLDTDERLELRREDLPLAHPEVHSINVKDRDHGYQKERLIRCGVGARWEHAVHERLICTGRYALGRGAFWELPKSEETKRARMLRGIEACEKLIAEGQANAHVRRHYAECVGAAGDRDKAAEQWRIVSADPEAKLYEKTWCEFRLAEYEFQQGRLEEARDRAARALGRDPGLIQELGALLSCLNSFMGDNQAALLWAMTVIGAPIDETRGGHRFVLPCIEQCRQIAAELTGNAAAFGVRGAAPPPPAACPAPTPSGAFDAAAFDQQASWQSDYALLARSLHAAVPFRSYLDLGAGRGQLLAELLALGVDGFGVELSPDGGAALTGPHRFRLAQGGIECWGHETPTHDLVSCVEVLEHIPESEAARAVEALCSRARDWLYLSAAAPGQQGRGHVNCRPKAYWRALVEARGFRFDAAATERLVSGMAGVEHAWWLPQNAMIFRRHSAAQHGERNGQAEDAAQAPEAPQGRQGLLTSPGPAPSRHLAGRASGEQEAAE
jgi:SAM-dependent methyltransferase